MYYFIINFHRLPLCAIINDHIRGLATKFPKTKFVRFVFHPNSFNFEFVIKLVFHFRLKVWQFCVYLITRIITSLLFLSISMVP